MIPTKFLSGSPVLVVFVLFGHAPNLDVSSLEVCPFTSIP